MTVLNCLLGMNFYKHHILAVTVELQSIAPSPGCTARATNSVVELVALSEATALAASRCQPTHLSVLVDWFGDPLGVRVPSDSFMEWINEDNLKKLIRGIFTNPVRIQDSQSPTMTSSSLLSNGLQASGKLELVHPVVDRLAVSGTLRNRAFAATAADTNPVYDITLLGLVAQPPRLVGPGGAGSPVQRRELPVLPAADPQQEAHHVRLLLPPQLLDVLVGAHLGSPLMEIGRAHV